jgi:succinate dehydrogenase/fumarate reductase cytochrome b subunit
MNKQEAIDFVVGELGRHHLRNDIIQKLCEQTEMNWGQAEKFIQQVEVQYAGKIASQQSPLVVLVGVFLTLAGCVLTMLITYATLQGTVYVFLNLPIPYLGNLFLFFVGVAMVVGGIRGMWSTIVRVWNS